VSGDASTSSSVVDIFASLHQFLRVIKELAWTDDQRKADFMAEAAVVGVGSFFFLLWGSTPDLVLFAVDWVCRATVCGHLVQHIRQRVSSSGAVKQTDNRGCERMVVRGQREVGTRGEGRCYAL
jgi:hypothetical protein